MLEPEFTQAVKAHDQGRMIQIAKARLKKARSNTERKIWRERLQLLQAGRELKFSRGELREVR